MRASQTSPPPTCGVPNHCDRSVAGSVPRAYSGSSPGSPAGAATCPLDDASASLYMSVGVTPAGNRGCGTPSRKGCAAAAGSSGVYSAICVSMVLGSGSGSSACRLRAWFFGGGGGIDRSSSASSVGTGETDRGDRPVRDEAREPDRDRDEALDPGVFMSHVRKVPPSAGEGGPDWSPAGVNGE